MYNLPYFKEHDPEVVIDFMKQHPFAMVIGVDKFNHPAATQVPVLIKERNGDLFLQAHIMKQTDHHKAFEKNKNILVVFSGTHTYVSASLYENQQQASTWNYQAVHVKGELSFLDDTQLLLMLEELTTHFENNETSPSLYKHLPSDYIDRLSKAIVAFEIKVTSIDHVFKLSQNRDAKSYQNIMNAFQKGNRDEQYIANEMSKRKDQLFNK
jgi:transcriptional regulator